MMLMMTILEGEAVYMQCTVALASRPFFFFSLFLFFFSFSFSFFFFFFLFLFLPLYSCDQLYTCA